ncbi:putative F-box domain-containing protein [Tanacetum coccineum]
MSDHIPFEIQSEIIKRLPIKPLVQCRSVSKQWKSLIDSSKFIADYHALQHLLLSPATFPRFPGRHVARDNLKGKARQGFFPRRLSRATWWDPHVFSQTNMCHGG